MQDFLDAHPDLDVSVSYVWLPMFPRAAERRALPDLTARFAGTNVTQYWDDSRAIGREVKRRLVPEYRGEVAWDMFLLFGPEATWADGTLLGWGYTIEATTEKLFNLLGSLPVAPGAPGEVPTSNG